MMRTLAGLGRCRVDRLARGILIPSVFSRNLADEGAAKDGSTPKVYELRTYHIKPKFFGKTFQARLPPEICFGVL